jgi:hypothetical protein
MATRHQAGSFQPDHRKKIILKNDYWEAMKQFSEPLIYAKEIHQTTSVSA